MPVQPGQLVGEKNGMYGKTHTDEVRRKMSQKVLKAYSEGRIPAISEHCKKLGQIAAQKIREEKPELWCTKIVSYITWLFNNTYTSEPSFADMSNGIEDALGMMRTEPQGKYWVALLQIDFDKVKQNLADNKPRKALASIFYYINPLVPEEAGKCYDRQYGYDRYDIEVLDDLIRDYCVWMIEKRNLLENYMVQCYALGGIHKAQYLEMLKRRSRSSWGDQSKSLEVKTTTNEQTTDKTLEIKIVEV